MSTAIIPFDQIERLAASTAKSGFFAGVQTTEQAIVLMMIAQAEGCHPIQAMQRYDIIKGKPAKKAWAMLADFTSSGGAVDWHEHSDKRCSATFSHPKGTKPVTVDWTLEQAKTANLLGNQNWRTYPQNMLHARCISNGVRFVYPAAANGMYTPEEVQDFTPDRFANLPSEQPPVIDAQFEPAPKVEAPKPPESLPPIPEHITCVPDLLLRPYAQLHHLHGKPIGEMELDDRELIIETFGKAYEQRKSRGNTSELGLSWLRAVIATASVTAGDSK